MCYPDLGCFDTSGPFGYIDVPPNTPEEIGTKFLLYPSHNRRKRGAATAEVPYNKLDEAYHWARDGFNGSLPTKVLIHGFGSDCTHIWVYEMRSALMAVVSSLNTISLKILVKISHMTNFSHVLYTWRNTKTACLLFLLLYSYSSRTIFLLSSFYDPG